MTPESEQSILNFFGILIGIAFTALLLLADRARSRKPPVVEAETEEDAEDDQYHYRTDPEHGAVAGAWARGRE